MLRGITSEGSSAGPDTVPLNICSALKIVAPAYHVSVPENLDPPLLPSPPPPLYSDPPRTPPLNPDRRNSDDFFREANRLSPPPQRSQLTLLCLLWDKAMTVSNVKHAGGRDSRGGRTGGRGDREGGKGRERDKLAG